jgi:REP element-mobilizing transposase RayT
MSGNNANAHHRIPQLFRNKYRIPSARLRGWDYTSAGWYFVTICIKNRVPCLADIVEGTVRLSPIGKIVAEEWQKTAQIRANVVLDAWVIMPNHVHGIIGITGTARGDVVETPRRGVSTTTAASAAWKSGSLGATIGQFKSVCTKRIWAAGFRDFAWQERFYDHIIRDERALNRIRNYIANNPARWELDRNNPENVWM